MTDLKVAESGINSKANEAAQALGEDVHVLRRTEINYSDATITINDLFKTILRDVQWFYEPKQTDQTLKITGTWQPGLFPTYKFTEEVQKILL